PRAANAIAPSRIGEATAPHRSRGRGALVAYMTNSLFGALPRWYRHQSSNVTRRDIASAASVLKLRADSSLLGDHQLFLLGRAGNPAAREALVRQYMPLARTLARRYDRSSEPFDDLLQV